MNLFTPAFMHDVALGDEDLPSIDLGAPDYLPVIIIAAAVLVIAVITVLLVKKARKK